MRCLQFALQYAALNFLNPSHNEKAAGPVKQGPSPVLARGAAGTRTQTLSLSSAVRELDFLMTLQKGAIVA